MKKILFAIIILLSLSSAGVASARLENPISQEFFATMHQPRLIFSKQGDIQVVDPEISQAFYDELKGNPRNYFISSDKDFELYLNLLVPVAENRNGKYSAKVFLVEDDKSTQLEELDGNSVEWKEYYEEFGRDYYMKGPELDKIMRAGKYRIEVFSFNPAVSDIQAVSLTPDLITQKGNQGKYVLAVGKKEVFDAMSILNVYWQLPLLKISFFKTDPLQFFLTPFGIAAVGAIGALLIILAIFYYLIGIIRQFIKHNQAKTLLLTSAGMQMKGEIIKLLQKPAYDITVAFISTAAKPQQDLEYLRKDWNIMRDEMGFNLVEIDIEGKTEKEVYDLIKAKDIIYVEGGNTFYLLNAMRRCNFEKIIRKLLKEGKVYIGSSAGSIVVGRTIKSAEWYGDEKPANFKNLKGLNLVPFDIFCHYNTDYSEIIKQKIKNPKKRAKDLKIITDDQAILVQGKEVSLIGKGDAVVV